MNLPSDLQRLLPYIAVAVLAVVGLFLVMRGVDSGGGSSPEPKPIDRGGEVRDGGSAAGGSNRDGSNDGGSNREGSNRGSGADRAGEASRSKRSAQAYISCVEQAPDTAALQKCQALLP